MLPDFVKRARLDDASVFGSSTEADKFWLELGDVPQDLVDCMVRLAGDDDGRVARSTIGEHDLDCLDRYERLSGTWWALHDCQLLGEDTLQCGQLRSVEIAFGLSRPFIEDVHIFVCARVVVFEHGSQVELGLISHILRSWDRRFRVDQML